MEAVIPGTTVTYIGHSGFCVETAGHYLIFDYFKGIPKGGIDRWLPNPAKKPLVFASHSHADHFNSEIFGWKQNRGDIEYILSADIAAPPSAVSVGENQRIKIGGCTVETLESTDQGVAFVVECDGLAIFHAGDLNWWHWEGEDEQENTDMARRYKHEIDKLKGRRLDIAFVPVDPRLEKQYLWGLEYLMSTADVEIAVPMHFWDDLSMLDSMAADEATLPFRDKLRCLRCLGESFTVPAK